LHVLRKNSSLPSRFNCCQSTSEPPLANDRDDDEDGDDADESEDEDFKGINEMDSSVV
jgi:hypothetical protein